jgi:hypothetical protein
MCQLWKSAVPSPRAVSTEGLGPEGPIGLCRARRSHHDRSKLDGFRRHGRATDDALDWTGAQTVVGRAGPAELDVDWTATRTHDLPRLNGKRSIELSRPRQAMDLHGL